MTASEQSASMLDGASETHGTITQDIASAQSAAPMRTLALEGGINFRDLGGYPVAGGQRLRWRRIFRSGALNRLSEDDCRRLRALEIGTVCDFRDDRERARAPTPADRFAPAGAYLCWPYPEVLGHSEAAAAFAAAPDPVTGARDLMTHFYRRAPNTFAGCYRQVFEHLLLDERLLFHCSAGKDRTGLMAALLLTALGAEWDTVMDDYLLTNRLLDLRHFLDHGRASAPAAETEADPAAAMFAGLPAEAMQALMAADPTYLEAAWQQIEFDHGSIEHYLEKTLGLSVAARARLRAICLEPAQA